MHTCRSDFMTAFATETIRSAIHRASSMCGFILMLTFLGVAFNYMATQTTHYIAIFCIMICIGAFTIYLKTNHNLGLQTHASFTQNTAPLSLAAFLSPPAPPPKKTPPRGPEPPPPPPRVPMAPPQT